MMSGLPSVPFRLPAFLNVPSGCPQQDLKQPRHGLLHAGVGAGKNVAPAVAIEVHKLWSRTGASPHAGHFGHRAFGLQPLARRELAVAKILVDADLSAVELSDEKVFLAIAIDVGPAGRSVTGAFDPDRHTVRFEADRRLELCGAAEWQARRPPGALKSNDSLMARPFLRVESGDDRTARRRLGGFWLHHHAYRSGNSASKVSVGAGSA